MSHPETAAITYPDTLNGRDLLPAGTLPDKTVLTYHLPQGAIEIRHKGDYLEMRCTWQRPRGWLAFSPVQGEMQVRVMPQE